MLLVVLVAAVVFGLQAYNRHSKGPKVAPAQVFLLHQVCGVVLVLFAVYHGVSHLLGGAPLPREATGILLIAALCLTAVFGALTKSARGEERRRRALVHRVGAVCALVLLAAHLLGPALMR